MLDGILGRGYSSKCKSLIKMTKSRIEVIRRKRNATLKFLKKDMADLLVKGLDINAYGRAEGLLAELILSSCYEYVEKSCDFVLKHLSVMQKMRHCPEDCREAVSSLMFAAARFSDLPELRDVRDIFLERYGSSLELFANQEFVENLSSTPITTEKKVQLMRDIASEFGITWDSKGFEQRASRPSPFIQEPPKVHGSSYDNEYRSVKGKDTVMRGNFDSSPKERLEIANDGYRLQSEKEKNGLKRNDLNSQPRYEVPSNGYNPLYAREEPSVKSRDAHDTFSQGRKEVIVDIHEPWKLEIPSKKVSSSSSSSHRTRMEVGGGSTQSDGRENTAPKRDGLDPLSRGKPDILSNHRGLWSKSDGKDSVAVKQSDGRENTAPKRDWQDPLSRGKPDILSNHGGMWSKSDGKDSVAVNHHHVSQYNAVNSARDAQEEADKLNLYFNKAMPPPYTKPNGKPKDGKYGGSFGFSDSGSDGRSEKNPQEEYRAENERQSATPATARADADRHEIDGARQEIGISNPIPKPRSSRRRPSRSRSSHDDVGLPEDTVGVSKRRSKSRRRDDRRGLQILFDDEHDQNDEEERMIDKLLIHYSKKPSAYEPGTVRRKPRSRQSHNQRTAVEDISRNKPDEISEMVPPPRSVSLPREQTAPSETGKVFNRAASFQPDRSSAAKHVHPKLPDYDDLAARFAALKGR
ncbi:uncharacterized protein [Euphorbia lathyris]|uniref:uncharacterized protein n=1 Tax=Euphorbia lathyris TaxID=212925 RepID=UPI003313BBF6